MGGEDCSSLRPPIIAAVLLSAIVALIGCGPTVAKAEWRLPKLG